MKPLAYLAVSLLAFALASLQGCGADFAPASRVTDFRLIAVSADKPFAAPGEVVTLRTLYHEPFGRPVTWAWTVCENPSDTTVPACLRELVTRAREGRPLVFQTGPGLDTFAWTVPPDLIARLPPQGRGGAMGGILTVACPGVLRVDPIDAATSPSSLPFHCLEAGSNVELPFERYVVAVKRIFVRERDKNQNPRLDLVTWDGAPWPENETRETSACDNDTNVYADCTGGEEHVVGSTPSPDASESGVDELGVAFTEQVVVQTYATEGTFEFQAKNGDRASEGSGFVARRAARGKEVTMWFVVRENRGGVSWTSRRLRVRP